MFIYPTYYHNWWNINKSKGLPQQAEVAQGVPGRLRPRSFLTFGTTKAVVRQPYAPAAFTPGEIPGTLSVTKEKIPSDTKGIDPETSY